MDTVKDFKKLESQKRTVLLTEPFILYFVTLACLYIIYRHARVTNIQFVDCKELILHHYSFFVKSEFEFNHSLIPDVLANP